MMSRWLGSRIGRWGMLAVILSSFAHAEEELPQTEEFTKGQAAYEQGKYDEAISSFETAVKKNPKDYVSWKHLGMALLDKGEPEKAIQALDKTLALSPDFPYALRTRGLAYISMGESDKGFADLSKAIKLSPELAQFHADLAQVYLDKNMLDRAANEITIAVKLDPKEAWNYCTRGQIHLQRKLVEKAIADFQEAQRLNPEIVDVHHHLGMSYLKKGNHKAAKESLEKYLKASKGTAGQDEWKAEAKKALDGLPQSAR